jgi:glycine cleavage system H protein
MVAGSEAGCNRLQVGGNLFLLGTTGRRARLVLPTFNLRRVPAMSTELVFMMGKFAARLPGDRLYSENHLWLLPHDGRYRVGFTSYSVRLLQDVYFLDWSIDAGTDVRKKQELGEIESSKALSTLYAPRDGRVVAFNEQLLNDPSAINHDNYGAGWLYEFATSSPLLTPEAYLQVLEAGWDETQRLLKGQMHD